MTFVLCIRLRNIIPPIKIVTQKTATADDYNDHVFVENDRRSGDVGIAWRRLRE